MILHEIALFAILFETIKNIKKKFQEAKLEEDKEKEEKANIRVS